MIKTSQLRTIIKYSLEDLGTLLAYDNAIEFFVLVAAHETHLGHWLYQDDGDPEIEMNCGLGIYQMERRTHDDVQRVLIVGDDRFSLMPLDDAMRLVYDIKYATQMGRIHLTRFAEPLPAANNIYGLASYHKRYWNTVEGVSRIPNVISDYRRLVLNEDA